jgi:acylphosphatase
MVNHRQRAAFGGSDGVSASGSSAGNRPNDRTRLVASQFAIDNCTIAGFMLTAKRFLIGGRVQGVGFRFFAEGRAAVEGLHGWVRNLPDGRVEVRVEGERESVDRFEAALRRGPSGARVESVEVETEAPTGRATGFSIRS